LLQDARLRFATLTAADLTGAVLPGADLAHARLDKANLRAADLSESCLDYANLDGANLSKLSLRGASLRFTRLSAATLAAADLFGANLTHARLDRADLKAANLSNARLDYADFAGAVLTKVDLRGANLQNAKNLTSAQLEKCVGDDSTILPPNLQGSVSWSSYCETRTAAFACNPTPAPRWMAKRSGAPTHSPRRLVLIAAVIAITTLAFAGWWQYESLRVPPAPLSARGTVDTFLGLASRTPLPSAHDVPTALKPAEAPALRARTIDGSDLALPEQRDAPLTLAATSSLPQPYTGLSPSAVGRTEITDLRPTLAEVRLISANEPGALAELRAFDAPLRGVVSPVSPASGSPEVVARAPNDATTLYPLPAPFVAPPAAIPTVRLLDPSVPLLGEILEPHVVASLQFAARKRDVLIALPPTSKIDLTSARVQTPPRETRWQNSLGRAHGDPIMLSVSLNRQMIDVYRGTALVMSSKVSSGMPGHETKPGVFSILEKQRFHHSNMYSGAPMPWMQRLTRSGTALHAGMVPGYPASHGCVRLPFSFAPKLFQITAVGETVLIAGDRLTPKPIEHRNLFQPHPRPVALAASAQVPWRLADDVAESPADTAILPLVISKDAEAAGAATEPTPPDDSDARAPAPLRILVTRNTPRDQLIGMQYALSSMGYLTRQNFDGTFGKATVAAIRAFQTANGLTETRALNGDLVKKVYEVAGKPMPPEGHLFVRQGFARAFDTPIAFRQPSQPLGTHIYMAQNFAAGDTRVRWVSVSLEGGDSASVLDRLEIPEDVRRTISESLTPGSSLIVADTSVDSAILPEGDDFLVWTNQPSAKEPGANVQSSNIKQANAEPMKPRRAARPRPTASPREPWPRPANRYTANRPPRFDPPRWFSGW
jgi:lipoprotein-anchoring transpeptidase ErfK/SrfK